MENGSQFDGNIDDIYRILDMRDKSKNAPLLAKEAEEKAIKTDKRRASYYNFYSDKEWGVSSSYDLSINSSILGVEETALLIKSFVEKRLSLIERYGVLTPHQ